MGAEERQDRRGPSSGGGRYLLVTADTDRIVERLEREGTHPRQDFAELARVLDARILSFSDLDREASPLLRLVRRALGPAAALALHGYRKKGSFYFTTAESAGMALALLLKLRRGVTHVMIGHRISAPKKLPFLRLLRIFERIDAMVCYSRSQAGFARDRLGVPAHKLHRIDFQVDERFFTPGPPGPRTGGVLSVGRELRDYPTLFRAVEGLDLPCTVVASSPWSRRRDQTRNRPLPANVTLRSGLSYEALRELYREARFVVVPLQDVDSPAGVTSILEAQATGRPVIVSRSPGILDSIDPGRTAVTVPCGDAAALRRAVERMRDDPGKAEVLGAEAREEVLQGKTLDHFLERIRVVCEHAEALNRCREQIPSPAAGKGGKRREMASSSR